MKARSRLEESRAPAMPWYNVIKSHLRARHEIKRYEMEDVRSVPAEVSEDLEMPNAALAAEERVPDTDVASPSPVSPSEYDQGYAKGFEEGLSAGKEIRQEELAQYEQARQLLLRLIDEMKDLTETTVQAAEYDIVQMAVAIAEKALRKTLSENQEVVLGMVQEAIRNIGPADAATIHIHPRDGALLTQKMPELLAAIEGTTTLHLEQDPSLQQGDCVVETRERMVDGRVSQQLSLIAQQLLPDDGRMKR